MKARPRRRQMRRGIPRPSPTPRATVLVEDEDEGDVVACSEVGAPIDVVSEIGSPVECAPTEVLLVNEASVAVLSANAAIVCMSIWLFQSLIAVVYDSRASSLNARSGTLQHVVFTVMVFA